MIIIKKGIIKFLTKVLRFFSESLGKEVKKNYQSGDVPKKYVQTKLKDKWYRCSKCRTQIEIAKMDWKYHKHGRYTTCPKCKIKIVYARFPKTYDPKSKEPYRKPITPFEGKNKPDIQIKEI